MKTFGTFPLKPHNIHRNNYVKKKKKLTFECQISANVERVKKEGEHWKTHAVYKTSEIHINKKDMCLPRGKPVPLTVS